MPRLRRDETQDRPCPKLAWPALRVVKASTTLNDGQKLVFAEIRCLDNGTGCYASAETLSDRLGKPAETVERIRRELKELGLLKCKRGRRIAFWFPTMPEHCTPTSQKLSADELERLRVRLDDYLLETPRERSAQALAPDEAQAPTEMTGVEKPQDPSFVQELTQTVAQALTVPRANADDSKTRHQRRLHKGGGGRLDEVGEKLPSSHPPSEKVGGRPRTKDERLDPEGAPNTRKHTADNFRVQWTAALGGADAL